MQTHGGTPAADAIEATGAKRYFRWSLLVDWDRDGLFSHDLSDLSSLVDEATTDRALAGTAPGEVMLVEGYAAASLAVTLKGERSGLNVVALFSTFNGLSPLYGVDQEGCEVKYKIGVETSIGVIWYEQFVGNVRTTSPKRGSGTVVLTALDRVEKMRQPVSFPIWAMSSFHSVRGWNEAQVAESQWVIDHCLRSADISTTPYRPLIDGVDEFAGNNQFWVTGNGSWLPSIGTIDSIRIQGFPKSEGAGADMLVQEGNPHPAVSAEAIATGRRPVNLGAMGADATGYRPVWEANHPSDKRQQSNFKQYRAANIEGLSIYGCNWFGFTLVRRGANSTWWSAQSTDVMTIRLGAQMLAQIQVNLGQARIRYQNLETAEVATTPYIALPAGTDPVQIDARIQPGFPPAMSRAHLLVNGATGGNSQTTFTTYSGTIPPDNQQGLVILNHQVALQDVYWSQQFATFTSDLSEAQIQTRAKKPAKYAAMLDRGLNRLIATPTRFYEDAWEVAVGVTSAELGSVFWNEFGVLEFWNRTRLLAKQNTIVRVLDLDDIGDLGNTNSLDSIRNIVSADAVVATSDSARVFEASEKDQFVIPAGETVLFRQRVEDMSGLTPWNVPRYATIVDANVPDLWTDTIDFGYVVQFETSPNVWQEQNHFISGVDIRAYIDRDYNLVIRVYNGYGDDARLATNGGSGALRLSGTKVFRAENIRVEARDQASVIKFGPRNLPLSGDWVQQQPAVVASLPAQVLERAKKPIPATDEVVINGDPRLQIGDCLEARDPNGMGESQLVQILGVRRTASRTNGLTDRLAVELIRPSLIGRWDSPQYGRWDSSLYWS